MIGCRITGLIDNAWLVTCWILFVILCQTRFGSTGNVPDRVVGIFWEGIYTRGESVASSEAVSMFQDGKGQQLLLSYEDVSVLEFLDMTTDYYELSSYFNATIMITDDPFVCEKCLDTLLDNQENFLIYTGFVYQNIKSMVRHYPNLYLTRPSSDAMTHTLYKLTTLVLNKTINSSNVAFVARDDQSPYLSAFRGIQFSLRDYTINWDLLYLNDSENLDISNYVDELNATLVVAEGAIAKTLLCHFSHGCYPARNRSLIFLGEAGTPLFEGSSFYDRTAVALKNNQNGSFECTWHGIAEAGEGHLFLEYPASSSTIRDYESHKVTILRSRIIEKIRRQSPHELDYADALLAFDSLWVVLKVSLVRIDWNEPYWCGPRRESKRRKKLYDLTQDGFIVSLWQAINTAWIKGNGELSGESVGQELKAESYIGLTGEKFSFVQMDSGGYVQSTQDAIINVLRLVNGTYKQIARHFNSNSSFLLHDTLLYNGTSTWRLARSSHCQNASNLLIFTKNVLIICSIIVLASLTVN